MGEYNDARGEEAMQALLRENSLRNQREANVKREDKELFLSRVKKEEQ